ncbi:MAG: hypothetical protein ACLPN5_08550 [Roseiarcus sp.]
MQSDESGSEPDKTPNTNGITSDPLELARRLAELARWWALYSFDDFVFLYGARRRGGRIVVEA